MRQKILNWHRSFKHNCIKVMIRWKIYWRCKWILCQTKKLEEIKNRKFVLIYIYIYIYIYICVCVCVCVCVYLLTNNLNGDGYMAGHVFFRVCTSPYTCPYLVEKVGDSPYPYPYPYLVNVGIPRQNEDEFEFVCLP